jgi:hypothetical protein
MHTLMLLAVLNGVISISPIREFRPYPSVKCVKCPRGYSLWWPSGKEFENDKYAQCIKPVAQQAVKPPQKMKDVSLRQRVARH